jgi:hypothetical protein
MTSLDEIRRKSEAVARGEAAFEAVAPKPTLDEIRKRATEEATKRTVIPHRGEPGSNGNGVPTRKAGQYLVDGILYPSVTTILKVIDKPALLKWAAKMGAKAVLTDPVLYDTPEAAAGAIYEMNKKDGQTATERGTVAHKVAEDYAKAIVKGTSENFISDNPYFPAIKSFFKTMNPEIYFIEAVLVNTKEVYAGTSDLIAKIGPRMYVIDWKTSKFKYPEMDLQVEAYRRCDMMIDAMTGDRLVDQSQMADSGGIVLLRDNGTFSWEECAGDFKAFLAAKVLYEWRQKLNGD